MNSNPKFALIERGGDGYLVYIDGTYQGSDDQLDIIDILAFANADYEILREDENPYELS